MNTVVTLEQFMSDVFTSPSYKPEKPEDPYQTEEYQKFVEDMVEHCHCRESNRPCDGVLAGGLCDRLEEDDERECYHTCDDCGQPIATCDCVP